MEGENLQGKEMILNQMIDYASRRFVEKFSVLTVDECWQWEGANDTCGYGNVTINGRNKKAHRVAWESVNGQIPEGMYICHRCDNPGCVNPTHLFIGTQKDNMRDMKNKGRRKGIIPNWKTSPVKTGEKNANAKLSYKKAEEIRSLYNSGDKTMVLLASMYGVNRNLISKVVRGKVWNG